MQNFINWLVSKKDIITTIVGIIAGVYQLVIFLNDFVNSPEPSFTLLVTGLFTLIIGWFTGKQVKK